MLNITCRHTGIQGFIDLPSLPKKALEYNHPLSNADSVYQVLDAGPAYIRRLEPTLLAGMAITLLRTYGLAFHKEVHPTAINKTLTSNHKSKSALLKLVNVLAEYIRPLHEADQTIHIPKINLDEATDAKAIAITLQSAVFTVDDPVMLDTEEYKLRKELRLKAATEAYRKLEVRRQVKQEEAKKAVAKTKVFELDALVKDGPELSTVEVFLQGKGLDCVEKPLTDLYLKAVKAMKDSHILKPNQVTLLKALSSTLFTMTPEKRSELLGKLAKYEGKYGEALCEVIRLGGVVVSSQSLGIAESIETIESEAPKPMSGLERLRMIKEARKS